MHLGNGWLPLLSACSETLSHARVCIRSVLAVVAVMSSYSALDDKENSVLELPPATSDSKAYPPDQHPNGKRPLPPEEAGVGAGGRGEARKRQKAKVV